MERHALIFPIATVKSASIEAAAKDADPCFYVWSDRLFAAIIDCTVIIGCWVTPFFELNNDTINNYTHKHHHLYPKTPIHLKITVY